MKNGARAAILLLALGVAITLPAKAGSRSTAMDITGAFSVLFAPQGEYAPQDFLSGDPPAGFKPLDPPTNVAALGQEAWLRVDLPPSTEENPADILEIPGQIFNYIDVWFRLPDGSTVHDRAGDRYPYVERSVKHSGVAFRIPRVEAGTTRVLIRAKNETSHSMNFAALVWPEAQWEAHLFNKRLWYGLFLGAILALCVYNSFLAATLREAAYFYYVGYILCISLAVIVLGGLAEEFLWPGGKPTSFVLALAGLGSFLAVGFVNQFLAIRKSRPVVFWVSSAISLLGFLMGTTLSFRNDLPLIPDAYSAMAVHTMVLLAGIYFIVVSLLSYFSGVKHARFLALSMLCLLSSIAVYYSYTYALVPYNLYIGHSLEFGVLSEGMLLSLALADRINLLHEQKRSAERAALNYQRSFSRQLIQAQERERQVLSETLHDSIGHGVLVLKNNLRKLAGAAGASAEVSGSLVRQANYCGELIDELRGISHELHPHMLKRLGLSAAIESTMQRALDPIGVSWSVEIDPASENLDPELQTTVYRAIQECLNNIMKYAKASEVSCEVVCSDSMVKAVVYDNGVGFDPSRRESSGLGLEEMEGRLDVVGGRIRVESAPDMGTTIELQIPLGSRLGVVEQPA